MAALEGLVRVVLAVRVAVTDAIDGDALVVGFARKLIVRTANGATSRLVNDLSLIPVEDAGRVSVVHTGTRQLEGRVGRKRGWQWSWLWRIVLNRGMCCGCFRVRLWARVCHRIIFPIEAGHEGWGLCRQK